MLAILPIFLVFLANPVFSSAFDGIRVAIATQNDDTFGLMGPIRKPKRKVHFAISTFVKNWAKENFSDIEGESKLVNLVSSGAEGYVIIAYFHTLMSKFVNLKKTCALLLFESNLTSTWAEGVSEKMLERAKRYSKDSEVDADGIAEKIYSKFPISSHPNPSIFNCAPLSSEHKKNKSAAKTVIKESFEDLYNRFKQELKTITDNTKGEEEFSLTILPFLSHFISYINDVSISNLVAFSASIRPQLPASYAALGGRFSNFDPNRYSMERRPYEDEEQLPSYLQQRSSADALCSETEYPPRSMHSERMYPPRSMYPTRSSLSQDPSVSPFYEEVHSKYSQPDFRDPSDLLQADFIESNMRWRRAAQLEESRRSASISSSSSPYAPSRQGNAYGTISSSSGQRFTAGGANDYVPKKK